jgi:hypothetical protein
MPSASIRQLALLMHVQGQKTRLLLRGLRKAGAARAAERGATTRQAEAYTEKADQVRLAMHAVILLARDETGNEIVGPDTGAIVAAKPKS